MGLATITRCDPVHRITGIVSIDASIAAFTEDTIKSEVLNTWSIREEEISLIRFRIYSSINTRGVRC